MKTIDLIYERKIYSLKILKMQIIFSLIFNVR